MASWKKKLCTVYCQLNWLIRLKTSLFHVVHNKIIIISNQLINYLNIFTSAEHEVKDSRRSGISVSKLTFFDKIRHAKSVDFRLYSAIWRSESRISSRYPEIKKNNTDLQLIDRHQSTSLCRTNQELRLPAYGVSQKNNDIGLAYFFPPLPLPPLLFSPSHLR